MDYDRISDCFWRLRGLPGNKADETYQLRKSGLFCENVVLEEHEKLVIRTKRGEELELIVADSGLSFFDVRKI